MGAFSGGCTYAVCVFSDFSFLLAWPADSGVVLQTAFYERGGWAEFLYLSVSWDLAVFRAGQIIESLGNWIERGICDPLAALLGWCFRSGMGSGILEKTR